VNCDSAVIGKLHLLPNPSGVVLQVRDIVLGHVVPQKLTFDDLKAMPKDKITPT
jgi:hypothetical protein